MVDDQPDQPARDPRHLSVTSEPIESLVEYPDNARRSDENEIVESIRLHDFYTVVTAQCSTRQVLVGNHRLRAQLIAHRHVEARDDGWTHYEPGHFARVDVKWLDVDDDEARRVNTIDNPLGERGTYDDAVLRLNLETMLAAPRGLEGTGYNEDDLAGIVSRLELPALDTPGTSTTADDEIPDPPPPAEVITRAGDLWTVGRHRVYCGDSRTDGIVRVCDFDGYAQVNVAITSPPYADRRKYDETSGFVPIDPDDYVEWFAPCAENVRQHLAPDGSWFVNIKPSVTPDGLDTEMYVLDLVAAHVRQWGWHFATEFCWERIGVPRWVKQRFKNQFEPVYQFALGRWKMRPDAVRHASNDVPVAGGPGVGATTWHDAQGDPDPDGQLRWSRPPAGASMPRGPLKHYQGGADSPYGDTDEPVLGPETLAGRHYAPGELQAKERAHGRNSTLTGAQGTNVAPGAYTAEGLAYPGNRLPTFSGSHEATGHAAAFPVGLPEFFINAYSDEGDVVLDPFAGSGSTLLAAERTDRVGLMVEISPAYCDVILRRFQRATGVVPERDGEPVDFLADVVVVP